MEQKSLVVGLSGASGIIYGIEFLKACRESGIETHLILSEWAQENIKIETDYSVEEVKAESTYNHQNDNLAASISSGSFKHAGMVIVPCSMKTLAAIANGYSETLLARAADVTLKEGRKLILVVRETPFSSIHLENMLKLSRMGVVILPPMPAMYIKPDTIDEIILHTVNKIFDQLGIEKNLVPRWQDHKELKRETK